MLRIFFYSSVFSILVIFSLMFIPVGSIDSNPQMAIYLVSNEIHTDIVLPVKNKIFDWESFLDPAQFEKRPVEWIEIGWGDREFYLEVPTWDKFTYKLAFGALFSSGPAVMHVKYLDRHPEDYLNSKKILISFDAYEKMVKSIKNSFIIKGQHPMILPGRNYSSTDNFYEAHGLFSLFRTCNVWTSENFKVAGLKHPVWSPTKYGLWYMW